MYILSNGQTVTRKQIKTAFSVGNARLIHGYRDASQGGSSVSTSLMLDGIDFDNKDKCESVWEQLWSRKPETLRECLIAAGI